MHISLGLDKEKVFTQSPQALEGICKKLDRIIVQGVADFLMPLYTMASELFSESKRPWIIQN